MFVTQFKINNSLIKAKQTQIATQENYKLLKLP